MQRPLSRGAHQEHHSMATASGGGGGAQKDFQRHSQYANITLSRLWLTHYTFSGIYKLAYDGQLYCSLIIRDARRLIMDCRQPIDRSAGHVNKWLSARETVPQSSMLPLAAVVGRWWFFFRMHESLSPARKRARTQAICDENILRPPSWFANLIKINAEFYQRRGISSIRS